MKRLYSVVTVLVVMLWGAFATQAQAQEAAWIQLEAQPSLAEAQAAAQRYATQLQDVNGFRVNNGWYAIALGPFTQAGATSKLTELRAGGVVPRDAYVAFSGQYGQQFWPIGANTLGTAPVDTGEAAEPVPATVPAEEVIPDETPREARAAERALDREARMELQRVLEFEGFYNSGIDGAFGPGTRRAMGDYQAAMGYEPTGVLTTRQRTELLANYQAFLESLGLQTTQDHDAGIQIALPSALVDFTRYEAPFAHYDAKNGSGVRVVLISQHGDRSTLFGLYDILQSLEIVPLEGDRERKDNEFTLTGTDANITSYTYAKLVDGAVKGFTLVWPNGDERRRNVALKQMRETFESLGDVALADNAGLDDAVQSLDLLSGLDIRRPRLSRSGFYVDGNGAVVTTAEAVQSCGRITVDGYDAQIAASSDALGAVLLKPVEALSPLAVAHMLTTDARLKSEVAVAGYSYEGRLSAPTLTFGTLADLTGLRGEAELTRLAMATQDGDAGGPVLDAGGAVIGMLLPRAGGDGQQLPGDVNFAADAGALAAFLAEHGVTATATDAMASMDPVDMSAMAADMTVLVSCWD
ncbi:serine protease [Aliiroseovarius sp.]|uniref:serine protease n=1 Tax=Aliiroseovarius sp. TaxID=1872442 RepID=UPI003BAC7689